MKALLLTILFTLIPSSNLFANERQEFLRQKALVFDGWQDDGLLELQKELPNVQRMSTQRLHKIIKEQVTWEMTCLSGRNVASDTDLSEECKERPDW